MGAKLAVAVKLTTDAEKMTRTTMDTIEVTPRLLDSWKNPPFQRPLRVNDKVRELAGQLKADGGVLPGIVTLGILNGVTYLLDGQHRKEAFLMSGCAEGYVDVRIHHFTSMADMGEEFVKLNSQLVRLRPDDILRGLEESIPALCEIRRQCPFVSYDQIRRGGKSPIVGMSQLLRCWRSSSGEVPTPSTSGRPPRMWPRRSLSRSFRS